MFSYKVAVAIKELGFTSIEIYNGGLKDWIKAGYKIEQRLNLPEYEGRYLEADELKNLCDKAEKNGCAGPDGEPLFTILDYRNELAEGAADFIPMIKTACPTIIMRLDDFADPEARRRIPKNGLVVLVCETGNRDPFAMRYLAHHGITNLAGLRFGMRAWIKSGFPVELINQR